MGLLISDKYRDFLRYNKASVEGLEGTTAAGKTTVGVFKFMLKVADSDKEQHILSAKNLGVAEKNIINKDLGILDLYGDVVEYFPHGKDQNSKAHMIMHTPKGDKTIYVVGYGDKSRWLDVLGGQYGCCYIDEINTADMAFVKQIQMRCDYLMYTLNPDDPDKEIYKELINRCRPIKKYKYDAPTELLKCLDQPHMKGWTWWYFTFDDNLGLSEEKKDQIKRAHRPGSVEYKHYIQGIRGKAEGVVFDNFDEREHTVPEATIRMIADGRAPDGEVFVKFTAGLDTAYSQKSDDTVAMTFMGITSKRRLFYIDEYVVNNRDSKIPFAPSDIVKRYVEFLDRNREKYGFALDAFIDSADQATITEARKYALNHGTMYNFVPAHKKMRILDRINAQKGWIATGKYYVCSRCKEHIKELETYSWSDKANRMEPEDANNHTIDSQCYAWIPFKMMIG